MLCRMPLYLPARAPLSSSAGSPARTARSAIAGLLHELPPKIFCPSYPLGQWDDDPGVADFVMPPLYRSGARRGSRGTGAQRCALL
jgi:hypothetical protein